MNSVGESLKALTALDDRRPITVRQGRMLATSFHPKLTDDSRIHELFARMVKHRYYRVLTIVSFP